MKIVRESKKFPLISKLLESNTIQSLADELEKVLRDERLFVDEYYFDARKNMVSFDIYDGDWKHEHLRAQLKVEDFFNDRGYVTSHRSQEIGSSDSDCYSAHHRFFIMEKPEEPERDENGVISLKLMNNESLTESKVDCFNQSKTGFSFYNTFVDPDDMINSRTSSIDYYKFEKGLTGRIVYMTCQKYFEEIAEHVFGKSVEVCKRGLDQDNIDQYAEDLKNGAKYNLPYIDYANEMQEGRHRMMAVEKVFGKDAEAPVLVVELTEATPEEIKDYAQRRWNTKDPYWSEYVQSGLEGAANQYSHTRYNG